MLTRYADGNGGKLPGIISCFGFGYSLDSDLLRQISARGGGMYSFIPGTAFVNSLANTLVTYANEGSLSLELAPHFRYCSCLN